MLQRGVKTAVKEEGRRVIGGCEGKRGRGKRKEGR